MGRHHSYTDAPPLREAELSGRMVAVERLVSRYFGYGALAATLFALVIGVRALL